MHTLAVPGVATDINDADVLRVIARATMHAARGPTTVIGIRNAAGSIYRVVHAVGVAECIALTSALEELGLVDDHHELDRVREGCDSIYETPAWHARRRVHPAEGMASSSTAASSRSACSAIGSPSAAAMRSRRSSAAPRASE